MVRIISGVIVLLFNLITTLILSDRKYSIKKTLLYVGAYTILVFSIARGTMFFFENEVLIDLLFLILSWSYLIIFIKVLNNHAKTIVTIMALSLSHSIFVIGIIYHIFMIYSFDFPSISFVITELIVFSLTAPFVIKFINMTLRKITFNFHLINFKSSYLLPLLVFLFVYISRFFISFTSVYILLFYYLTLVLLVVFTYLLITKLFIILDHNNKLSAQLHIDPLTNLHNRLGLYKDFDILIRDKKTLCVYFLDLNRLKLINDNFGHIAGDTYLVNFSDALRKVTKPSEKIYRISGDEFIILSTNQSYDINNLKLQIKKHLPNHLEFSGVSIGLAKYLEDGDTLDELLHTADKRMYIDKQKAYLK